ncbi:uncharacterized protein LOC125226641 [Leguminivora glycinivorella]|uniref:uncharacterized protein LOC125226641 n=1 Tax=Leguminivora glycinivorella TaxID=1035111 RepID=UPI00200F79A8|nr:uncharacterized protein LOC125226641 [Leguminivora glycinivorella]
MGLHFYCLLVLTWTVAYAAVPSYLKNLDLDHGYKSVWKPSKGQNPSGIEFGEISRGSLLKIMAEFAQNVEQRLRPRQQGVRFDAHFANNKYTRPYIYPRFGRK